MIVHVLERSIHSSGVISIQRTNIDSANSDHGAVNLVDNTVNLLQIVGVGDDLIIGNNILQRAQD